METTLNGNFNPKSAIISRNTNTKNLFLKILTNNIRRDGLSQKTISRYCPFKPFHKPCSTQHTLVMQARSWRQKLGSVSSWGEDRGKGKSGWGGKGEGGKGEGVWKENQRTRETCGEEKCPTTPQSGFSFAERIHSALATRVRMSNRSVCPHPIIELTQQSF